MTEPYFVVVIGRCFSDQTRVQEALQKLRTRVEIEGETEMHLVVLGAGYASQQAVLWAAGVGVGRSVLHVPHAAQETPQLEYLERAMMWFNARALLCFTNGQADSEIDMAKSLAKGLGVNVFNVKE